jgi:hypothetical protein
MRKIWFGEIDLTVGEPKLIALAQHSTGRSKVLYERDGHFGGRDGRPLLERAV